MIQTHIWNVKARWVELSGLHASVNILWANAYVYITWSESHEYWWWAPVSASKKSRVRRGVYQSAETMYRGVVLQRFSFSNLCVSSRWLTSLGRKPRRTQWSLAVEANSALRTRGEVSYPRFGCITKRPKLSLSVPSRRFIPAALVVLSCLWSRAGCNSADRM